MTGLVRKATILCVGGLLLAGAAMAGIPSAANSTIPTCLTIADVRSTASCNVLIIRDANNNPVSGASVTFDFSACANWGTDVRVCDTQEDQATVLAGAGTQPTATVCGSRTVTAGANALGELCVILNGATTLANGHGPAAGDRPTCVTIYADNKPMGTVVLTIASFDLNNTGTVTIGDLSVWGNYLGGVFGAYRSKADYNCTGSVNIGDLAQWGAGLGVAAGGGQVGCVAFCP